MKITTRQILIVLTSILTLVVNGLANALPLNGLTTGEISDSFDTLFVPAGYVFSIWGLIYIGLIAYTLFQIIPSQRKNPRLVRVSWWVVTANLANASWIFFWHYQIFALSLVAMLILLISLLAIYQGLRFGDAPISTAERWFARLPFSIYLGWISVATIANVSDVLYFFGWNQFGISAEIWMVILLLVVSILAWTMSLREKDLGYLGVLLWALAGIGIKFPNMAIVTPAIWTAFVLTALATLWAGFKRIKMS